MVATVELTHYLDELLAVERCRDFCPNGLQVAGKATIQKIISGVTACQALLEAAIAEQADAILVHHGYFWKGENARITGIKQKRLQTLLKNDINLFAYHLPLDTHAEFGNNVQLAKLLNIEITVSHEVDGIKNLFFVGRLAKPISGDAFAKQLTTALQRTPLHIAADKSIETIGWCTGAAHRYIEFAAELNVDAYLTGEAAEATIHHAREANLHFYAAGHHATERYGVQALGAHVAERFGLEHQFIDIDNPV